MRQFYIVFLENTSHHPFGPPDHPSIHPSLTFFFGVLDRCRRAYRGTRTRTQTGRQHCLATVTPLVTRMSTPPLPILCGSRFSPVFSPFLQPHILHAKYRYENRKTTTKKNSKANRKKKFTKKNLFDILTEKHNFENVHGARVCECESRSACVFVFAQGKRVEQCSIVVM